MLKAIAILALSASCFACTQHLGSTAVDPNSPTHNNGDAEGQLNGAGEMGQGPAQGPENAFITQLLTVHKEPSEAKDVADSGKKRRLPNWVATVYRGEQVTTLATKGDWLRLRLSDGKEGWAKQGAVLAGSGIEMATVFEKVKTFSRPDLLSINAGRQLEPGSLVFALRSKDQFSEVNAGGASSVWVLSDVLSKDTKEVEAAKLINRARVLKDSGKDSAGAAEAPLELAKAQFAGTHLVQTLLMPPPPSDDPNEVQDPNLSPGNPNGVPMPIKPESLPHLEPLPH